MSRFPLLDAEPARAALRTGPPRARKVVRVITRLNIGGPAQHAVLLTAHLGRHGWTSRLLAGRADPHEGDMSDLAAAHEVPLVVVPTLRNGAGPLADIAAFIWLYRYFRRERPDVVHLHLLKARLLGGLAARLARVPLVVETFHGALFADYYRPSVSRFLAWLERGLARLMDGVVAVSDAVADELRRLRVTPDEKITVIPLGLNLEPFLEAAFAPGVLRRQLGVGDEVPLIGVVGRLVPIKGLQYFVEAAAEMASRLAQVRFVIVGDGSERPALERQVSRAALGGQVHFVGWRRDLERVYPDLDVVMLTSLNEGTPVSLIEAMAAGRAVVATRVGGVPDVVQDGLTGLLVSPRDAHALAEATLSLLQDPETRRRMGEAARRAVFPRFAAERLARDMDAYYRTWLGRRGIGPEVSA